MKSELRGLESLRCGSGGSGAGEHLWFLENLDRVNQAIQGTDNLEEMMRRVLSTVLEIFDCDRAWLLHPCDPEAGSMQVPMEVTRPAYPGALALGRNVPIDSEVSGLMRILLDTDGPIELGPGRGSLVPAGMAAEYHVQSLIAVALYPKSSASWIFGLHQCAHPRTWSAREARLFQEIGRRLADALGTLSVLHKLRESEERARLALDVANLGSWWHDMDDDVVHLDARTQELYGFDRSEMTLADAIALAHPDDVEEMARRVKAAHDPAGTGGYAIEHRIVLPDGTVRWVAKRARTHFSGEGTDRRAVKVVGTTHDITQRKLAEEALRASEQRFRTFVDHAADAFFLHGDDLQIIDVNQQASDALGYSRDELIGMSPLDIDTDYTPQALNELKARLTEDKVIAFESHHRRKDGSVIPVEIRVRAFREGGRLFAISSAHDITERIETQRTVSLFRTLIDHANDAIEVLDPETKQFLDVNDTACRMHGYTRDEYMAMTAMDLDPWLREQPAHVAEEMLREAARGVFETEHRRKDGSVFPVEIMLSHIQLDRDYILAVVRDITERKQAEAALVRSHNLLNAVVEGTEDIIYVKDLDGRYLLVNAAGAQFFGRTPEQVTGNTDRDLFAPEIADKILESDRTVLETGESQTLEETNTAHGALHTYLTTKAAYRDAAGKVLGVIGISRDVTEIKRLEEQFSQAQKMEAVGRLAGGIAHDFNNLLTVISGNSELAFRGLPPGDASRELIVQIQQASERASALTRQLLAFSRKQVLQPQVVSLHSLLDQLLILLRRLIGEDVEIALGPDVAPGLAKVDPGQFEQAIINLAVNARDAMPRGGKLVLETRCAVLDGDDAGLPADIAPGPYVLVSVSDTGHGMDQKMQERIFEPFYTTKPAGKGTGLGLAMVYGFVKQSDGHIDLKSEPGAGTTFRIYLPQAEGSVLTARKTLETLKSPGGTETILLVEDEEAVRELARKVLQSNGYTVLYARDGQEALDLVRERTGPLHLVLTDVVMPRLSGPQLVRILSEERPGLQTLFISGYADPANADLTGEKVAFLQKPFTSLQLARKVRDVLDR